MTIDATLGLTGDPFESFLHWFGLAEASVPQAEAAALATASAKGRPSARVVLFKGLDEGGFTFHTNYNSRKGKELAENPQATLLFFWQPQGRQIRIEGRVEKLEGEASSVYFASRERESRLGAWASHQSAPLATRDDLIRDIETIRTQFEGEEVPRPEFWGGYRLIPDLFEFWQHQDSRLHDRFEYKIQPDGGWHSTRLAP